MSGWVNEMLSGVDRVDLQRAVPGMMIVYGDEAHPILTNSSGECLLAAAELGRGRIAVFSHGAFTKAFIKQNSQGQLNERFVRNISNWVNRGRQNIPLDVQRLSNFDSVTPENFLIWIGTKNKEPYFLTRMMDWIRNGGSLICGTAPWAYDKPDRPMDSMPLYYVLNEIGIAYATKTATFSDKNPIQVGENLAHVVKVNVALEYFRQGQNLDQIKRTIDNICDIPLSEMKQVKTMIEGIGNSINIVPTNATPVSSRQGKMATAAMNGIMIKQALNGELVIAKGIASFPGRLTTAQTLKRKQITCRGAPNTWHPTGCYVPESINLSVSWEGDASGWSVAIGGHTDKLYNIKADIPFKRWPEISVRKPLDGDPTTLSSPFGGLVYLISPSYISSLTATISNIVEAPRFILGKTTDWSTEAKKPGPWCDISGNKITFTLPSKAIRELTNLDETMRRWDTVVGHIIDLRGTDPYAGRPQWIVSDQQIKNGYMHAGYAIMTGLDVADKNNIKFALNGDQIVNGGMWGLFHEIGHNFQHKSWTFNGTDEVTNNVFALYTMDMVAGVKPFLNPWLAKQMAKASQYLKEGANYYEDPQRKLTWEGTPGVALVIYAQLARDFGWEMFKKVFRGYEDETSGEMPANNKEEIKQWITRFSFATKVNLCPQFDFWGFPYVDEILPSVQHLPAFLPRDKTTTSFEPNRAKRVAAKYNITW